MKIIEVEDMYECPFQIPETFQIGDMTWDTRYTCKILDGNDCEWDKCPMRIHKQYRIKWIGK